MKRFAEHIFVRSFLSKAERNYTLRQNFIRQCKTQFTVDRSVG